MRYIKKMLAAVLAVVILSVPALAVEGETRTPQAVSLWAYSAMADIYALGMWTDDYYYCILDPVTEAQLTKITDVVAAKLALLKLDKRENTPAPLVLDGTRGAVLEALYREVADYALPHVETGAVSYLASLGVIAGEPAASRACTLQEALVMAQRLILAVYDSQDAGAKGFLWKAEGKGGNTLYLLGTVHADRGNVYPFHKSLRDAIAESTTVSFEIDFGDQEDINTFSAMQFYSDGATLKEHIPADLYALAVKAGAAYGVTEEQLATFKPWALVNALQTWSLIDADGTSGGSGAQSPMVLDQYVYSASVNLGHTIQAVESAVFQGTLFDELSADCQEDLLRGQLENRDETAEANVEAVDKIIAQWCARSAADFETDFDKETSLKEGGEYMAMLFTKRDPGMISYADDFLKEEGQTTAMMTVGAGHMIGQTGVVQGLKDLGYTVELAGY